MAFEDGSNLSRVNDTDFVPLAYLRFGYAFSEKFKMFAEGHGISVSENTTWDAGILARWQIDRNWDLGLGYRYLDRKLTEGDF